MREAIMNALATGKFGGERIEKDRMINAQASGLFRPELFERAAELIIERGWHGGRNLEEIADHKPNLSRLCIMTACGQAVDEAVMGRKHLTRSDHNAVLLTTLRSDLAYTVYLVLSAFLGVPSFGAMFALNDSHSQEDGPVWAVEQLRALAEEIR